MSEHPSDPIIPKVPSVAPKRRKVGVDASTQAVPQEDTPSWSAFDVGVAMQGLRSGSDAVRRRLLRRLHVRWWHVSYTKMCSLLGQAGIPKPIQELCKDVVNTCQVCRLLQKTGDKPMAKTRLSTKFNEVMQVDILFWKGHKVLHMVDECTRFSMLTMCADKTAQSMCSAMYGRVFEDATA